MPPFQLKYFRAGRIMYALLEMFYIVASNLTSGATASLDRQHNANTRFPYMKTLLY